MKQQSDTAPATEQKRVLFLCSGNYYRSRLAEILFNHEAAAAGIPWVADSRGMLAAGELKGLSEHAASYLKLAGLDALLAENFCQDQPCQQKGAHPFQGLPHDDLFNLNLDAGGFVQLVVVVVRSVR